jgi:hypothetical protein|tara:strand:- start:636 stop:869 length:234 start_codon:yes stop_codon:yes gene_type:complete
VCGIFKLGREPQREREGERVRVRGGGGGVWWTERRKGEEARNDPKDLARASCLLTAANTAATTSTIAVEASSTAIVV